MRNIAIELSGISKSFGPVQANRDINLSVETGTIHGIVGENGAGKSTFVKMVYGLLQPDSGQIMWRGTPTVIRSPQHARELGIGMVFQHFNLFPHMTVLQNVMEGPRTVLKLPKSEYESRALSYLEKVGIPEKRNAYPSELSGGQQQRVAIARALAMEPEIMLFDEATSALDPELVGEVLDVILKLMEEGLTCVLVTHELGFAYSAAQRVLFMHNGMILEEGSAYDVLVEPQQPRTIEFLRGHSRFQLPSPKSSQ